VQGFFRIRQSWSHQNRRPAVAPVMPGGGGQPARGHIPAQRSIPGPAVVTTHAAHIHLVQTGKTATKSLKILR
jgi:hypothetical protein